MPSDRWLLGMQRGQDIKSSESSTRLFPNETLQWQALLSSTLKESYVSSMATPLLWEAHSVISGMQRANIHICLISKEPLYPFLPCCCFSVALVGFTVFFPPGTFLLTLILASFCTLRSSSKDMSDWSGREHRAHLNWTASQGTSPPQTPSRGMSQSLRQWHKHSGAFPVQLHLSAFDSSPFSLCQ